MLADNAADHLGFHILIRGFFAIPVDFDEDIPGAETKTSDLVGRTVLLYLSRTPCFRKIFIEGIKDDLASCRNAGRPHADPDDHFTAH